jgi:4-hydroxy-2-oxoheptanedioate aldolase
VQNAEEAKRAVQAVRYPPHGVRGVAAGSRASNFGRIPGYAAKADGEICLLVQVETKSALEQLEAIASVEGIDGVFIGPGDLSASLGHIANIPHPETQAALKDAAERLANVGKASGILTGVEAEAKRYIEWGYNFVAVGTDTALLRAAGDNLVKTFKS